MNAKTIIGVLLSVALVPAVAGATDRPEVFDFEYTFPANPEGSPRVDIQDNDIQWFGLDVGGHDTVVYLEFEIAGLTHESPMDLRIELLSPISDMNIVILDSAGWQHAITDTTLIFNDKSLLELPHGEKAGALQDFSTVGAYGRDGPGTFSQFTFLPAGEWLILVTDSSGGDVGSFESMTLRGLVPEPATLSLMALGALALLRRRRR